MEKMKMHSPNLTQENIARIRELFPTCVTEAKGEDGSLKLAVDFDQLRQELSDSIVEGPQERYHLNWPGKREALLTANAPIAKTLRPCREESVDFDTTKNLFIEGDNLEALKLLQETYLGKVKMIYIDPPYNTGNDFIYEDDFAETADEFLKRSNQKDELGNRLMANTEANGRFHSDWLSMLYPRLKLARNLLKDDGVIFISIGDEEESSVKNICNEIFGEDNYRNCFAVRRHDKNLNRQFMASGLKTLNVGFEFVLVYAKSQLYNFNPVFKEASETRASNGYWKGFWNAPDRPTMRYDILGFTPNEGQWKWKEETALEAVENYKLYESEYSSQMTLEQYWESTGKVKKFIRRNHNGAGRNMGVEHWIEPSEGILRNSNLLDILATQGCDEIRGFFDFPKNIELLSVLCQFASEDNDLVLDFFAGSATTAHAVMQLNAEDGGNRKFIMVQLPEPCDEKSEAFKTGYKTIAEISKERIRRAGKKIKEENAITAADLDIGFRVLKIDSSNMADVYYRPDQYSQDMLATMEGNIKPDRTPEDLLFQVLLDWGVDLTLPIKKEIIQDKTVFFVDENALVACFDNEVNEELVKELARFKPIRVVFRDNGFVSDAVKINVEQIFKQMSPGTEVKSI
ncbi:MAG: site-specific DNA-methyltransferase [Deltaproteobacteria bacterium]|nr:site-specific DNA-methyltransferase [Deltaproteobacteria bacterium]